MGDRVHAHNGVEPAVGDPRAAIGRDDHAVRRGAPARGGEGNEVDRFGDRIEPAEMTGGLSGEPDTGFRVVAGAGDVVRVRTTGNVILAHGHRWHG